MSLSASLGRMVLSLIVAIGINAGVCAAQQVGSIDLSQVSERDALRRPAASSGEQGPHGAIEEVHDEVCGAKSATLGTLRTTLVSLDRANYSIGDEPRVILQIKNIGTQSIRIPFSSDLARLQPADPGKKFIYYTLVADLWVGGKRWSANTGGRIALFGDDEHPGSMIALRPGEWVQVIGRGRIEVNEDVSGFIRAGDVVSQMNVKAALYRNESLMTANGTAAVVSTRICIKDEQGAALAMEVTKSAE